MKWTFTNDRPIYLQIVEQVEMGILSGIYKPGEFIPSVRDLALEAEVNPNTMQKALSELEQRKLLLSQRTTGRFVTEDKEMIEKLRVELAQEHIEHFINSMHNLGLNKKQIVQMLENKLKEVE